ncbi:hypothetical protein HDU76_006133 [Blyttiomyces sp. JEL0837]|nr:hypothetical protein HDU76_006133 [Blyttiomyces sp. JEL0837]
MVTESLIDTTSDNHDPKGIATINSLPTEVIANIIKCLKFSSNTNDKKIYRDIQFINRKFRDAMALIPKCIDVSITIDMTRFPLRSFGRAGGIANADIISLVRPSGPMLNWRWSSEGGKKVWYLVLATVSARVNANAIPRTPVHLVHYLEQYLNLLVLGGSAKTPAKAVYSTVDIFDLVDIDEYIDNAFKFLSTLRPKCIHVPFDPSLPKYLKHDVEELCLMPPSQIGSANFWIFEPVANHIQNLRLFTTDRNSKFTTLEGLSCMRNVQTLLICEDAVEDLSSEIFRNDLPPNLKKIKFENSSIDITVFPSLADQCPSLSEVDSIVIDDPDFFLSNPPMADWIRFTDLAIVYNRIDIMDLAILADGLPRYFPGLKSLRVEFRPNEPTDLKVHLVPEHLYRLVRLIRLRMLGLKVLSFGLCHELEVDATSHRNIYCRGGGFTRLYCTPLKTMFLGSDFTVDVYTVPI